MLSEFACLLARWDPEGTSVQVSSVFILGPGQRGQACLSPGGLQGAHRASHLDRTPWGLCLAASVHEGPTAQTSQVTRRRVGGARGHRTAWSRGCTARNSVGRWTVEWERQPEPS